MKQVSGYNDPPQTLTGNDCEAARKKGEEEIHRFSLPHKRDATDTPVTKAAACTQFVISFTESSLEHGSTMKRDSTF